MANAKRLYIARVTFARKHFGWKDLTGPEKNAIDDIFPKLGEDFKRVFGVSIVNIDSVLNKEVSKGDIERLESYFKEIERAVGIKYLPRTDLQK